MMCATREMFPLPVMQLPTLKICWISRVRTGLRLHSPLGKSSLFTVVQSYRRGHLTDIPDTRFTARGIVAICFSALAGVIGIAVVAWYGMSERAQLDKREQQLEVEGHQNGAMDNGVLSDTKPQHLVTKSTAEVGEN